MEDRVRTYKNGRVELKRDGLVLFIEKSPSVKVHLSDDENRYYFFRYMGVELTDDSAENKLQVMNSLFDEYQHIRGTRTSWTLDDAWKKKWLKRKGNS